MWGESSKQDVLIYYSAADLPHNNGSFLFPVPDWINRFILCFIMEESYCKRWLMILNFHCFFSQIWYIAQNYSVIIDVCMFVCVQILGHNNSTTIVSKLYFNGCQRHGIEIIKFFDILVKSHVKYMLKLKIIIVIGPRYSVQSRYLAPSSSVRGQTHVINFLFQRKNLTFCIAKYFIFLLGISACSTFSFNKFIK